MLSCSAVIVGFPVVFIPRSMSVCFDRGNMQGSENCGARGYLPVVARLQEWVMETAFGGASGRGRGGRLRSWFGWMRALGMRGLGRWRWMSIRRARVFAAHDIAHFGKLRVG